jgi:hypothetical protein
MLYPTHTTDEFAASSRQGGRRHGSDRKPGIPNRVSADVRALASNYTVEALEALVRILRNEITPAAARVAAIREILDRGHGKPMQPIAGDPRGVQIEHQVASIELIGVRASADTWSGDRYDAS